MYYLQFPLNVMVNLIATKGAVSVPGGYAVKINGSINCKQLFQ